MSHKNNNNFSEAVMDLIPTEKRNCHSPIRIGATCVAQINGNFFLLVEIEFGADMEEVIVIRISATQAAALLRLGVPRCQVSDTIPVSTPGREVNLICAFVVGDEAILVFDVENATDELVLVRTPLCTVIG